MDGGATLEEVRRFFRTWYTAGSATLVIAGDVDRNAALGLAKKYFGPIVSHPVPPQPAPGPVRLSGESRVEVEAGVELPAVYVGWPTPAVFQDGDAELNLAAGVLGSGDSSRLYQRLVHDLAIAQSVSVEEDSRKLSSVFAIVVNVRVSKNPSTAAGTFCMGHSAHPSAPWCP